MVSSSQLMTWHHLGDIASRENRTKKVRTYGSNESSPLHSRHFWHAARPFAPFLAQASQRFAPSSFLHQAHLFRSEPREDFDRSPTEYFQSASCSALHRRRPNTTQPNTTLPFRQPALSLLARQTSLRWNPRNISLSPRAWATMLGKSSFSSAVL